MRREMFNIGGHVVNFETKPSNIEFEHKSIAIKEKQHFLQNITHTSTLQYIDCHLIFMTKSSPSFVSKSFLFVTY